MSGCEAACCSLIMIVVQTDLWAAKSCAFDDLYGLLRFVELKIMKLYSYRFADCDERVGDFCAVVGMQ